MAPVKVAKAPSPSNSRQMGNASDSAICTPQERARAAAAAKVIRNGTGARAASRAWPPSQAAPRTITRRSRPTATTIVVMSRVRDGHHHGRQQPKHHVEFHQPGVVVQRQQRSPPDHAGGGFDKQRKRPQQRDGDSAGVSVAKQQRQAGRDRCCKGRHRKCGDQDHHSAKPLNLPNEANRIPPAVIEHGKHRLEIGK